MAESKGRPKKKQFKPAGAQLVQGLLAGADDVANRSWIGGGQGTPESGPDPAPAAPPSDEATAGPPRTPQPRGGGDTTSAQEVASIPDAAPVPADEREPAPAPAAPTAPGPRAKTAPAAARSEAPSGDAPSASRSAKRVPAAAVADAADAERPADQPADGPSAAAARPRRQRAARGGAHAAVQESFTDAKIHSSAWQSFGFRISPDVLGQLKDRVNTDRRTSGNSQLAIGHYLDAALRQVPGEVSELIDLATDFAMERIWDTEKSQPSSYRVGPTAYEWVSSLNLSLQEADFARKGTLVVSAVVERYLQALEAEGPLQRPERRRKSP